MLTLKFGFFVEQYFGNITCLEPGDREYCILPQYIIIDAAELRPIQPIKQK